MVDRLYNQYDGLYLQGKLDDLINQITANFHPSGNWEDFFVSQHNLKSDRGKVAAFNHKATHLLSHCK